MQVIKLPEYSGDLEAHINTLIYIYKWIEINETDWTSRTTATYIYNQLRDKKKYAFFLYRRGSYVFYYDIVCITTYAKLWPISFVLLLYYIGVRTAIKLTKTKAFRRILPRPPPILYKKCSSNKPNSDAYFECLIRYTGQPASNIVGTNRMGGQEDNSSVVDPQLRWEI
jgi:hypothetical protein